jgi:hypothetical protein
MNEFGLDKFNVEYIKLLIEKIEFEFRVNAR